MFTYKRTIKSGPLTEIEYYRSFRKIGKNYGGRKINQSLTPERQKRANRMRAIKNMQRLILCNFTSGDYFVRLSVPRAELTEDKFEKIASKWKRKMRDAFRKIGKKFKYISFTECGKLGKNWHMHIIVEREALEFVEKYWEYDGINFTALYQSGYYEKLAEYITKDVAGEKRIRTARCLKKPDVTVKEAGRREIKKLERGEMIKIPDGCFMFKDDKNYNYNDITGASWYFAFLPLAYEKFDIS